MRSARLFLYKLNNFYKELATSTKFSAELEDLAASMYEGYDN